MGKFSLGKIYKISVEKLCKLDKITNAARRVGGRAAEKIDHPRDCPWVELFLVYSILNRVVTSQSTRLARSIGYLGAGQPNPIAKSKS